MRSGFMFLLSCTSLFTATGCGKTDHDPRSDSGLADQGADSVLVDQGSGSDFDHTSRCFPTPLPFNGNGAEYGKFGRRDMFQRFENKEHGLRVFLKRHNPADSCGGGCPLELHWMMVEHKGTCTRIDDPKQLEYTNTHHNWSDEAKARANGIRYEWVTSFTTSRLTYTFSAIKVDSGEAVMSKVPIINTGGDGLWGIGLHITELMANNIKTWKNADGEFGPWIEIRNIMTRVPQDISGFHLSDDPSDLRKWAFPEGTVVPAGGFLVVAVDGKPDAKGLHASFRLSKAGGYIISASPDGTSGGEYTYPGQDPNVSLHYDMANDAFVPSSKPTPGEKNPESPW